MKKFISVFLSLIILVMSLTVIAAAETQYLYSSGVISKRADFHLVAHKGVSSLAPENSLAAIKLAGKYGYWGCRFDVQPTSDGKWVLMENSKIDDTTNGSGYVSSMTYSDISKFVIDEGNGIGTYPDEKVPELSQALDLCKRYSMKPVIEIRNSTSSQIKALCTLLSERKEKADFIIVSLIPDVLITVKERLPEAKLWLSTIVVTDYAVSLCKNYGFSGIDAQLFLLSAEDITKINAAGLTPAISNCNSLKDMESLYRMGVKYVETSDILPLESVDEKEIMDTDNLIVKIILLVERILSMVLSIFSF